jgi:hypothetical protein
VAGACPSPVLLSQLRISAGVRAAIKAELLPNISGRSFSAATQEIRVLQVRHRASPPGERATAQGAGPNRDIGNGLQASSLYNPGVDGSAHAERLRELKDTQHHNGHMLIPASF